MAGFVNHEIGKIDEEEIRGVGVGVKEEKEVENKPNGDIESWDGFPFAEIFVEPVHEDRVTAEGRSDCWKCGKFRERDG
jgi:hypothetical protein